MPDYPITFYHEAKRMLLTGELSLTGDNLDIMLVEGGYSPDAYADTRVWIDGNEGEIGREELNYEAIPDKGYVAGYGGSGRRQLTVRLAERIASGARFDAADVEWANLVQGLQPIWWAVCHKRGTVNDTDALPVFYVQIDPPYTPQNQPFALRWPTDGICLMING